MSKMIRDDSSAVAETSMLGVAARFANEVILVLDLDGRLLDANERFWSLYGYAPSDLGTLSVYDIRSPRAYETISTHLAQTLSGHGITFETLHRRKDGFEFPVEVSSSVTEIKGIRCAISVVRDLTELKAAQARINRLDTLLNVVTSAQRVMAQATDESSLFQGVCDVAIAFGLKLAWIGFVERNRIKPACWAGAGSDYLSGIEITVPPGTLHSTGPTGRAVQTGVAYVCNDFLNSEETRPWHDRARRHGWGASASFPLIRDGRPIGAFTIYSDTPGFFGTEEIDILNHIANGISCAHSKIEADRRNADLERILQRSVRGLVDFNIEQERFADIYSHDLQEPVRNIVSFAQLLSRRLEGRLDSEDREVLGTIVSAAMTVRQLNLDLAEMSRINHECLPLVAVACDEALDYALAKLGPSLENSGAIITRTPLPTILGTEVEMRQVFLHLISNAVKFSRPGCPPRISVTAQPDPDGTGWRFCIADEGIGIDSPFLDKVFTVFFRLHPQARYPGSGAGLAIVSKVIERQGGRVWIESELGKGTEVFFHLNTPMAAKPDEKDRRDE